ncbi:hypothetical protein C5167_006047 [Papaver somniferum]|uniref:Uncharacterized protein n=1 Tax=Papaver somniferum TaxID=3469 RepID=A0A4Y7JFC1_PAPSO|nr:hypothetical protein C5167_006047 [Papaver somniferum]
MLLSFSSKCHEWYPNYQREDWMEALKQSRLHKDCDWGTWRAPNWMKCPVAVSFVSCKHSQPATNPPTGSSEDTGITRPSLAYFFLRK